MKFPVIALVLAASTAFAQSLTINTPTDVQVCVPTIITWSGGTGPYFVSLHDGNNPDGPALIDFGLVTGSSLTWTPNQQISYSCNIKDSTGTIAQSARFTPAPPRRVLPVVQARLLFPLKPFPTAALVRLLQAVLPLAVLPLLQAQVAVLPLLILSR